MAPKAKTENKQRAPKEGKRLATAYAAIDRQKAYGLNEALKLIKTGAKAKFDETVEIAINLGVDPKQSDQVVRGVVPMPSGVGKDVRVAVFATDDKVAKDAKAAGADVVGGEELVEEINKGNIDFDRCIATPDVMQMVSKAAKVLGPRGLMPNPKLGTVTDDIANAIKEAKSGQVEFRADKGGVVHAGVGKASFKEDALQANVKALMDAIIQAKPSGAKGTYIKKITLSSTMGPGVMVDIPSVKAA